MKGFLGAALVVLAVTACGAVRADEKEANAVIDKAIKALGGEEKLRKLEAYSVKSSGKITLGENENSINTRVTVQGIDRFRSEFEGEFNGNEIKGVVVLDRDKGWRKFGENAMEMDGDAVANEKRSVYLQVVSTTILPLKGKGFKAESAGEEKVGDKDAVVLKVTGPDGKDFKLSFDKASGLPVRMVATVAGFNGQEFTQDSTYSDYKEFEGVKKATKLESKRDGQKFIDMEVTEFKRLEKVDPDTFSEPK